MKKTKNLKSKNKVMLILLLSFVVIMFIVTIVKMGKM
jgi:hypothetical protein